MATTNEQDKQAPPGAIYCFIDGKWGSGDVVVLAVAEDGVVLGSHVSSSVGWAKRDIGLVDGGASRGKHEMYADHYPDGYRLEWVDDPAVHEGIQAAFALNKAAAEATS